MICLETIRFHRILLLQEASWAENDKMRENVQKGRREGEEGRRGGGEEGGESLTHYITN